jgi:hypothetical protein
MTFEPEKRPQTKADVVAPCAARAHLRPLDQTELLDRAVVVFYRPRKACPLDSLQLAHLNFIRRPQFNVAVCGNYLEDANEAVTFEPHHTPRLCDLDFTDRTQALAVGVNFAVTLQSGQPSPVERANQLEVFQSQIPAIEGYSSGPKASLMRSFDHRLEVIVFGQSVLLLVKDAIVAGGVAVTVRPQQRNQVDAAHHPMMFTRPVARHQLDLLRIRLIQGRVVYDKDALAQAHLAARFLPQRVGVRLKAVEQAGESIMGRRLLLVALYFRCFSRAHGARRGDHEVNVVIIGAFRRIHALFLLHFLQLRNF